MAAFFAVGDHVENLGMDEGFSPSGQCDIFAMAQFIHHCGEMGPTHVFQFDSEILPLAHGAVHIATVGDFNLDLPGA
jgi:hypothetical protein